MSEPTDHLGRELTTEGEAQTVTQFAVQQGTVDPDAPGVQNAITEEQERAQRSAESAQQVSDRMTPPATGEPAPRQDEEQEERSR
jgi:hypothetical protein